MILVVFLAGYLSENRPLLVEESTRVGPLRLPPLPYLAPMVAMWAIALGHRRRPARPRRGAAVLRRVPARCSTSRRRGSATSSSALVLFVARRVRDVPARSSTSGPGSTSGSTRSRTRSATGYQVVQSLYAFARGGLLGTGLGGGPAARSAAACRSRRSTRTSRWRRSARSSGSSGSWRSSGCTSSSSSAGCGSRRRPRDDFRALLAAGLALVIGVQAFIIAAGNLKLIPLTGITLPFISYGGSSLLANAIVVGLLLALSDRGVEPPPPPPRGRLAA